MNQSVSQTLRSDNVTSAAAHWLVLISQAVIRADRSSGEQVTGNRWAGCFLAGRWAQTQPQVWTGCWSSHNSCREVVVISAGFFRTGPGCSTSTLKLLSRRKELSEAAHTRADRMADSRMGPNLQGGAGFLAKRMQKSLNRAQEKVRQDLQWDSCKQCSLSHWPDLTGNTLSSAGRPGFSLLSLGFLFFSFLFPLFANKVSNIWRIFSRICTFSLCH